MTHDASPGEIGNEPVLFNLKSNVYYFATCYILAYYISNEKDDFDVRIQQKHYLNAAAKLEYFI